MAHEKMIVDDFTASYVATFDEWQRLDDLPDEEPTECEMLLATFAYDGARAAASNNVPKTISQAAISALIAYDEMETLVANHGGSAPPRPLRDNEREALRTGLKALRHTCVFLCKNGGEALRLIADWHGLLGEEAAHV